MGNTSPPQISARLGSNVCACSLSNKAERCEGTILSTSMGCCSTHLAIVSAEVTVSLLSTCTQPPEASAQKMAVLPRSAASVETVAYCHPGSAPSCSHNASV